MAIQLGMRTVGNGRKNTQIISVFIFLWPVGNGNGKAGIGIRDRNNRTFENDKVGTENMSVTVGNDNSSRKYSKYKHIMKYNKYKHIMIIQVKNMSAAYNN